LDLLVLEGCFLKTPPQSATELHMPINTLERDEDPQGIWRHWCNDALAHGYPPLWQCIDVLWFLHPPDFAIVPEWRWQQEQALQARHPDRHGMTREQIVRFVQFFERVTRQSLRCVPAIADRVVHLDRHRRVQGIPRDDNDRH
jgi:D-glycerate 3-kinase